jgi:acetyl esterase/lipase
MVDENDILRDQGGRMPIAAAGRQGAPGCPLPTSHQGLWISVMRRPSSSVQDQRSQGQRASARRRLMSTYNLDPPAAQLVEYFSQGPALNQLPVADVREAIDGAQAGPVEMPDVEESWITVPSEFGDVPVLLIRPRGRDDGLPATLYMHGGGWIFGSAKSHGRLARELAVASGAAVAFIDYSRAPEARYPVQIEQCYAVARWVNEHGARERLDGTRIAVAGDSAGGNMATVLAILAKQRGDVRFVHQSLYYPMTDALTDTDSESYRMFKDGPYGTAEIMEWFWSSYLPDPSLRSESTVSPLRAAHDELEGLPTALVIVDENDILRDQGEAYANRLREAGVPTASVRVNGTMHDFMMLNALHETESARAAKDLAAGALRRAFGET